MSTTTTEQQNTIGREVFRLHQLSAEAELIFEYSAGEVTSESTLLEDWIAGASDDTLHAIAQFRAELEARAAAIKVEADRLAEVKERNRAKLEWAKARALEVMKALGKKSVEVGTFKITVLPPKPHVEQVGEKIDFESLELIDSELVSRGEPKPNKPAILKLLNAGREVPGFRKVDGLESIKWK